jgi:hypothetical protein
MGVVSKKLRDSARGQDCTLRTAYCNYDPATTVLAHLPSEVAGKATKSDDFFGVYACSECHFALDNHLLPDEAKLFFSLRALQRTQKIQRDRGLIVIAGDNEKPRKQSSKIVRPISLYRPDGV